MHQAHVIELHVITDEMVYCAHNVLHCFTGVVRVVGEAVAQPLLAKTSPIA